MANATIIIIRQSMSKKAYSGNIYIYFMERLNKTGIKVVVVVVVAVVVGSINSKSRKVSNTSRFGAPNSNMAGYIVHCLHKEFLRPNI